jgi:hypothetical protein
LFKIWAGAGYAFQVGVYLFPSLTVWLQYIEAVSKETHVGTIAANAAFLLAYGHEYLQTGAFFQASQANPNTILVISPQALTLLVRLAPTVKCAILFFYTEVLAMHILHLIKMTYQCREALFVTVKVIVTVKLLLYIQIPPLVHTHLCLWNMSGYP